MAYLVLFGMIAWVCTGIYVISTDRPFGLATREEGILLWILVFFMAAVGMQTYAR